MKVYRVKVKQYDSRGLLWAEEHYDVKAPTAGVALTRALAKARQGGFFKSRPLEVTSLEVLTNALL